MGENAVASTASTVEIYTLDGVEGTALVVNDVRVAGPKPWGGGTVGLKWNVDIERLHEALPEYAFAPEPKWLSVTEAATRTGVHPLTIARARAAGRLKGEFHARRWRFAPDDVDGWASTPRQRSR